MKVADGTSLETAAAAVERAAEAYAQAVVQDREEFAAATGAHDEMLNMVYALLLHQPAVDDDGVEGCPAPSRARRRARATR